MSQAHAPFAPSEAQRLAALESYDLLNTAPDPVLDRITELAADLFDAPMAALTLIDQERQWLKARVGGLPQQTSRNIAFCHHTIADQSRAAMVVQDATQDERFCNNPLVVGDDNVRFYAGAPLTTQDGYALGALCVLDRTARHDTSACDLRRLHLLAQLAVDEMELRRVAKTVREQERLLSLAETVSGVGHWRVQTKDHSVSWSPEVYRIHGVDPATFTPDHAAALDFYLPEDREVVSAHVNRAFRDGQPFAFEQRLRRSDGDIRHVSSKGVCERDAAGVVTSVFGVFQDVTEQMAMIEAANAASAAKTEFLANMSHELRTPLNSIIGFTHLILNDDRLHETHRHQLKRMEEAGRGLLTLINDVLDFSKVEEGRVELASESFSPQTLMEDTAALVHLQAVDKGISLVVDFPSRGAPQVVGDVDRLRQVLLNLLSNALKFTAEGHVRLGLTTRRAKGRMQLEFEVSDTGIGMTPEHCDRLFERFVQADSSISRRFGGAGLGLAISKRLVEAMGGEMSVRSGLGAGTTFRVKLDLPITEASTTAKAAPDLPDASEPMLDLSQKRVLVADDVPVNRELVRLMLAPLKCEVTAVCDGEEAVKAVGAQAFDLILMDMQMPVLDGLAATRRIRGMGGAGAQVPIVALTASALPEQVAKCRAAGMDDHVAKPFVPEDLISAVLHWCQPDVRRPQAPEPKRSSQTA